VVRLYLLFASIYLLEGITEVPFIVNVYLKKVLEFSPSQIGQILFLGGLWFIVLKPLIGFLADFWKRFSVKAFLSLGVICSFAGWLVIANAQNIAMMTLGVSLKVIAVALLDVLIDGMIVTVSTAKNRSFIQSLVYGCRFGGGMACGLTAGWLIGGGLAGFVQFYYVFSLLSLVLLVPVMIFRELGSAESKSTDNGEEQSLREKTPDTGATGLTERLRQLTNPAFGWLLLLMLFYAVGADTSTYFDPVLEERFGMEFLGTTNFWLNLGTLCGILLVPVLRLKYGMKVLFVVSLFGWSLVEISCLGIALWNGWLIYFLGGFFNAFAGIAILTVATAMCKIRGIETFAFAFAISVKNFFDQSNVLIGGYVFEAVGLTWLFVISSLCGLLPFLVLRKIDFRDI
jgi:predicted MFS family arabinose efflux permease